MAAPCGQSPHSVEIHFAQRLASNEKKIRDRAIKRLRHWIAARSQKNGNISNDELMKLWKGLFYCMWMCDKPVIQEELADQISDMAHCFRRPGEACLFYETFLATMRREWIGIDHLRMDKYLMLIRRSFRQMLVVLHNNEWEEELVKLFLMSLSRCALNPDMDACPDGLRYQLANVYLDELAREGTEDLSPQQASTFLFPYAELVAKTLNKKLRDVILQDIFQDVVERSSVGEAEEDEDEGIASDEDRNKTSKKAVKQRKRKRKGKFDDEEDDEDEEEEEEEDDVDILEKVMFPEEMVPPLEYDYAMIADKLFELASEKNIPTRNRKPIYRMVKRFQSLAKGVFPMPDLLKEIREDKDTDYLKEELPWWKKLQEKEKRKNRRRKRRRGKKGGKGEGEGGGDDDDGEEDEEEEIVVKKKKKVQQEDEEEMETDSKKKIKKQKKKEKMMTMTEESKEEDSESLAPADVDSQFTELKSTSAKGKNKKGKRKGEDKTIVEEPVLSETAFAGEDAESEPSPSIKDGNQKRKKKKGKAKITDVNLELSEGSQTNSDIDSCLGENKSDTERIDGSALVDPHTPRTKSKKKGKKKGLALSGDTEDSNELGLNIVSKATEVISPQNEGSPKPFAAFDKVSTPVAYVKKAKKMTEPSTLPRTKAKSRVETQFSPPMTRKRVKIALSKNEFQPATDYKQRIKQSPGVPFDGTKKPAFSVLKQTPPKSEVRVPKVKGSSKKQGKVGKRPKAKDFF
ncbi:ribosomal RNA processing protein 1 homolog A-like [Lytechinus variegatus]|uniref:ribosomal RNA processing protein 1 homolog A-like n=1 Tax=Lytechinus variegatus TaxID=7654 RepID=UPI001BB2246E|nr:ribosomal RNA processing protein 1 homolog A-like [Lytechinus variegatus]